MKNISALCFFLCLSVTLFAQKFGGDRAINDAEEKQKYLYNYSYGSYYIARGSTISSFSTVTYISNGKQQFGIGTGILSHYIKSDSGDVNFMSVPVFLSNKFFIIQTEGKGGLYIDFQAGFNLPVSALYASGEAKGNPVPAEKVQNTGLYGVSAGVRLAGKKAKDVCFMAEIGYRNEHVPFSPDNRKYSSNMFGISLGLSF
jgi:hypothetical protein